jgi:hypothetical protein
MLASSKLACPAVGRSYSALAQSRMTQKHRAGSIHPLPFVPLANWHNQI